MFNKRKINKCLDISFQVILLMLLWVAVIATFTFLDVYRGQENTVIAYHNGDKG